MYEKNYEMLRIDVKEIMHLLIRRLWIIIMAGILCAAATWLISKYLLPPIYTSKTSIYIINRQDGTRTTYSDLQTGSQLTKDFMFMVTSRPVLESVIEILGIDMSTGELADSISVRNPDGTRILEIRLEHKDPHLAKQLAETVAKVSSDYLVNIMEIEKVNIVEEANLPDYPSRPNITRNVIFGAFTGFVAAVLSVIAFYLFNDNIKNADDIERYLGITTLGVIPLEEEIKKKSTFIKSKIAQSEEYAS